MGARAGRRWLCLLAATPAAAWAHSPVPGLGTFYNGMLHPVLAPPALLALLALGLLIGQRGLPASRGAVLGFVAAVLLGLLGGSQWPGSYPETALLLLGLACAACVLAAWRPPAGARLATAMAVGGVAGWALADMATGQDRWIVIAGTTLGASLLALGVAAIIELAQQPWQHIAVRVAASWLAASTLLVLGLQWAGPLR